MRHRIFSVFWVVYVGMIVLVAFILIPKVHNFHERNKFVSECRDNFMPYMAEDTALNIVWVVSECQKTAREVFP